MKKFIAMVLALVMVFALAACGSGSSDSSQASGSDSTASAETAAASSENFYTDDIDTTGISVNGAKIVYLAPTLDIEYWQWVEEGVRLACEEYGASYTTLVAENSAASQAENGETAVTKGVDAVVLSPVSSDSCSSVLDVCEDAGIPVTIAAIGSTADNYFSFISADDYTSGYDAGLFLCQQAKELGGDSIGVLALPMDRTNAQAKMSGLEKACQENGITIAQTIQTSTLTVSDATDECNDLLTAHPEITGIYCMYEQAGVAAVDCLENAELTGKIAIVSSDGSPASIADVRNGTIAGIVVQEAVGQGYYAAIEAFKAISGLEADAKIIQTPEPLVTASNIDSPDIQKVLSLTYPASAGAY
jgi:ribose transport system substrate-binding protein